MLRERYLISTPECTCTCISSAPLPGCLHAARTVMVSVDIYARLYKPPLALQTTYLKLVPLTA